MKYTFLIIIVGFLIGYLIYEYQSVSKLDIHYGQSISFAFPDITGPVIFGSYPENKKYNKYVVHLWATWCPTCKADMPALIKIINKHPNTFFYMMSVKSEIKKVKKIISKTLSLPGNLVFIEDYNQLVKVGLGTDKLPESHVFSTNKKYIKKVVGENIVSGGLREILK